jgi:rubrerythrin
MGCTLCLLWDIVEAESAMEQSTAVKVIRKQVVWKCERCGHEWLPKTPGYQAAACPKCKSPYWNRPRKQPARHKKPAR